MSDQEHEQIKARMNKIGSVLLGLGGVFLIAGIVLFIIGISRMLNFDISDPGLPGMGPLFIGIFLFAPGAGMLGYGIYIKMMSRMGKITKFFAKETAPATRITTEAATDGFAAGLSKHGMGIGGKEVVKIKCRNCGYLETEDAEFCSKCGQEI